MAQPVQWFYQSSDGERLQPFNESNVQRPASGVWFASTTDWPIFARQVAAHAQDHTSAPASRMAFRPEALEPKSRVRPFLYPSLI